MNSWGQTNSWSWKFPQDNQWDNRNVLFEEPLQDSSPIRDDGQWYNCNSNRQYSQSYQMDNSYSWRDEEQIGMTDPICISDQREESLSGTQLSCNHGSEAQQSLYSQEGEQEEEIRIHTNRLPAMMDALLQSYQQFNFKMDTEKAMEQHLERIQRLEQAQSSSDKVIKEQAKKIKSLEDTVQKLEIRLKNQQHEQMKQYEANLRRIKQLNIEVPNLREQMHRADALLCKVQKVEVNYINPDWIDDSSDGEEVEPDPRGKYERVLNTKKEKAVCMGTVVQSNICNEHFGCPSINPASFPSTSSRHENIQANSSAEDIHATDQPLRGDIQDQRDDEELQLKKDQLQFLQEYLVRPTTEQTQANIPSIMNVAEVLKTQVNMIERREPCFKKDSITFDEHPSVPEVKIEKLQAAALIVDENQVESPREDVKALLDPFWEAAKMVLGDDMSREQQDSVLKNFLELTSLSTDDLKSMEDYSHTEFRTQEKDVKSTGQFVDESITVHQIEKKTSCGDCGLNCTHQLRACVNMIQVMPSVKRVSVKEIGDLKRTTKRKLQQQWVPCGIFDIKEHFTSNSANVNDLCVKSYMPQWRKRKRRTSPVMDSYD